MADCHNLFQSFHTNIQILSSKKAKLKKEVSPQKVWEILG